MSTNHQFLTEQSKKKFEGLYGKNTSLRNAKQWKLLVKTYGINTVMRTEKMTKEQVTARMNETFTQRFNRQIRERRA